MKRPPGLWLLLSAGVLCLSLQNVYGLKATELIFGKTTTTTTEVPEGEASKDGASTEASEDSENSIKSNLTGIPQIDYLFDPNLPRELNGYNLSSYPFYNSMPEDIDFKCDGLHDGFYASVPHKCQVYHHCLFGTRYDFLCANYTAFDQKTFICHFVSEVDCNNSHKYWHRNDALYQAATTTTVKPPPVVISPALSAAGRRPSPAVRRPRPSRRRPQYEYYDEEYDDDGREDYYEEPPPRRRRKRPRPRPRPVYEDDYEEYEDDRYERRGSGRRNGERRKSESDDRKESDDRRYKQDDEKSYEDRQRDDDRKPHDRKDGDDRRNREPERKPYDSDEGNDRRNREDERKPYDRKPYDRRPLDDRRIDDDDRKPPHDRREYDDRRYEDRPTDNKRYKEDRRRDHDDRTRYEDEEDSRYDRERKKENDGKRRPDDEYKDDRDDRRSSQDKRSGNDRPHGKRRPADDFEYDRPRKSHRRPYDGDYVDERDDRRNYNRPRKPDHRDEAALPDEPPLVKPSSSSSVFNQPRMPPRIRPPILKNEQNKFTYKPTSEKPVTKKPEEDDEYYDYEDELPQKRTTARPNKRPEPEVTESRRSSKPSDIERNERRENKRPVGLASRPRLQTSRKPPADPVENYEEEKPRSRPHSRPRHDLDTRNRPSNVKDMPESDDEEGKVTQQRNPISTRERSQSPKFIVKEQRNRNEPRNKPNIEVSTTTKPKTTSASSIKESPRESHRERPEPVIKVHKRPFLPSRGGNPYSARGLQPVGAKALENSKSLSPVLENVPLKSTDYTDNLDTDDLDDEKHVSQFQTESSKPVIEQYDEPNYKPTIPPFQRNEEKAVRYRIQAYDNSAAVQNGRQFPTSTESKEDSFLIDEQPDENYKQKSSSQETYTSTADNKEPYSPEEKSFKPSPILIKVPVRLKYSNPISTANEEEFRPVANRPAVRQNNKPRNYDSSRTTEKPVAPERNPLDINENEYDVTLNDALNPTIPNLPIRNFPNGFSSDTDYTFSSFQRPRYEVPLNQASESRYQIRSPSHRVETVQPFVNNGGKKYATANTQYNVASDQVYQSHNFQSSPQITQAQAHAFYPVY